MTLLTLWLPILLSAGLVFIVSSILHMVLPTHKSDYAKLPQEDALLADMRSRGLRPGNYAFPRLESAADMKKPEMLEKYQQGPVGFLQVLPEGPPAMGKALAFWFLYSLVVGVFVAYLTSHTVAPGSEYWTVFRVAGTAAFLVYALGEPTNSIWRGMNWSTSFKNVLDGLIYSLVVAGSFAGFWPQAL